jgi:hypothetical protein
MDIANYVRTCIRIRYLDYRHDQQRNINELDEGRRAARAMISRVTVCPEIV